MAQIPEKIFFENFTVEDGLPGNPIRDITQDSLGFMWFAAEGGVARYDGYEFEIFRNIPGDNTSISDNDVERIVVDKYRNVWINTFAGIDKYDPLTNTFIRHFQKPSDSTYIEPGSIEVFIPSRVSGDLWIGDKRQNLLRYNPRSGELNNYSSFVNGNDTLSITIINDLVEDGKGNIWISTGSSGILKFDIQSDTISKYEFGDDVPIQFNDNSIPKRLFVDSENKLWIDYAPLINWPYGDLQQGDNTGLLKIDLETDEQKLLKFDTALQPFTGPTISPVVSEGTLWFTRSFPFSMTNGLHAWSKSDSTYRIFNYHPYDSNSLISDKAFVSFIDSFGSLWVGTQMGLSKANIIHKQLESFSIDPVQIKNNENNFSGILEVEPNIFWIYRINDDPIEWDRQKETWKTFKLPYNSLITHEFDTFGSLIGKKWGDYIWYRKRDLAAVGSYNLISGEKKSFKISDNYSKDFEVLRFHIEDDRNIWISNSSGISHIDPETGKSTFYPLLSEFNPGDTLAIEDFAFASIDTIWCMTNNERLDSTRQTFGIMLNKFDAVSGSYNPIEIDNNYLEALAHGYALDIMVDSRGDLWISKSNGLVHYDVNKDNFTLYNQEDGLSDLIVLKAVEDNFGMIWLATQYGISRFDPQNKSFRNFRSSDGLQMIQLTPEGILKTEKGEIIFTGVGGLNIVDPAAIVEYGISPSVIIKKMNIGGNRYVPNRPLNEINEVTLPWSQTEIEIEYSTINFRSADETTYSYRLEGLNENFINAGTRRFAHFTNLEPGNYKFRVRSTNAEGVSSLEDTVLAISILPPWWRAWWAYGLYTILFLTALYSLRKYELTRFNLKNQLKIEKIQTGTLRNLDQLKSQFFANISHEFRTPLTLILGQTETMLQSEENRRIKERLISVNTNAERLLGLINQLLDLSKLEAGKMNLQTKQQNIVSFLKNLLFSFESLAETNRIQLNFYSSRSIITMVFDAQKMEQVFLNLFSNAFQFTGTGGRIDVSVDTPVSQLIEIRIKDTGIGIPEEQLPHVFDRFYQSDQTVTRKHEGTGIGLALAQELVELHQGSIRVFSEVGVGTEFVIQFPYVESDVQTKDEKELKVQAFSGAKEKTPPLPDFESIMSEHDEIVLIVEDNDEVRSFIREQLDNEYTIMEAANGVEGIKISQDLIPDLIITDLMMPEMDGYRFSKKIRSNEKTSHIPVIMLTARAGLDSKIEGLEVGIDAYLTKPYHIRELKTRVKTLIEQRKNLRKQFSTATYFKPSAIAESKVDQAFLTKAIDVIDRHLQEEEYRVEHFAQSLNMSISQLNRKLNALVEQPAGTFIRSIRLQRSTELLNQTDKTIAEVCFEVGFNDQAYFSRAFKKQYGKSPSAFRKLSI